jgi:hypothetical protein
VTDATSELYSLDPDDFVAARDALAKRLRMDGDVPTAAAVKALRRPTVPVWLLNVVARSDPGLVDRARELAAALRDAHDRALSGGDGSALRELAGRRRAVVDDVVRAAVEVAAQRDRDVTAPTRDAVATTIEAALADGQLMDEWAAGTLREVGEPSGFSFGNAVPTARADRVTPATAAHVSPSTASSPPKRAPRARSDEAADDGERRLREASAKAARLRAEADEAKAEVEVRKAALAEADRAVKSARQSVREAERAASRADLFAATAEQAAWEMGERTRR